MKKQQIGKYIVHLDAAKVAPVNQFLKIYWNISKREKSGPGVAVRHGQEGVKA